MFDTLPIIETPGVKELPKSLPSDGHTCSVELGLGRRGRALAISSANGSTSLVILLVEDEFLVRDDIAQYLSDCGCIVLEADTAERAVAMGRDAEALDVLLTDITLGDSGTGWDVAEALRATRPDLGVVYVSGNAADQSRRVANSLLLNKPYEQPDVLQACRDVTDK